MNSNTAIIFNSTKEFIKIQKILFKKSYLWENAISDKLQRGYLTVSGKTDYILKNDDKKTIKHIIGSDKVTNCRIMTFDLFLKEIKNLIPPKFTKRVFYY